MKTILFYWSKGADTRVNLIRTIADFERRNEGCYLNLVSDKLKLSHVAVKKHLDLLIDEDYVKVLNPGGKPNYLALTDKGIDVLKEFSKKN